ncbi:Ig-like domain-containing protein [Ottowia thiooxydans]|uniref:Ig-like domain-containing protein n=1 Tax=Ottowia thiooxydans TaxID=219182 RepID=UPI00339708F9
MTPHRPPGWSIADAGSNVWTDGGPHNSYGEIADSSNYKAPPSINDLIPDFVPEATNASPAGQAPSAPAPALIPTDETPAPSAPEQSPTLPGETGWSGIPRGNLNNPYGYTPDFTEPEAAAGSTESAQAPAPEGQAPTAVAPARPLTREEIAGRNAQTAASTFTTMLSTLNGWENMTAVQKSAAMVSVTNSLAAMSGNTIGPAGASLKLGSALGLAAALERGDLASAVVNGLQLVDTMTQTATAAGIVSQAGGQILPFLNLILAVRSEEPTAIANAALGMYTAFNPASIAWTGPVGFVIAIIGVAIMSGERTPIAGWSEFSLDENGQLSPRTTFDQEGGGNYSHSATQNLVTSLQGMLSKVLGDDGQPLYAINPARLPQIGYWYSPDSMMYQGEGDSLLLRWVEPNGETVTRFYNGRGERADGSGENIMQDFIRQVDGAIVPSWMLEAAVPAHTRHLDRAEELERQAQALQDEVRRLAPSMGRSDESNEGDSLVPIPSPDPVRYEALGSEIDRLRAQALAERDQAREELAHIARLTELGQTPEIHEDGTQSLRVLTIPANSGADQSTAITEAPRTVLFDLDNDGYFEPTQWIAPGQALLGIDLNADGRLDGHELLSGDLGWLDANQDGRVDVRDPAYRAIVVWNDANGDGRVQHGTPSTELPALPGGDQAPAGSELSSLKDAGISALDYGSGQVRAEHTDGSVTPVPEQELKGDQLGVKFKPPQNGGHGVVRVDEQRDGSGSEKLWAENIEPPQSAPPPIAPPPPPPPPAPVQPSAPAPIAEPPPPPHINRDPVAQEDTFRGEEDQAVAIGFHQLLQNDWDHDTAITGDVLTVTAVGEAQHGRVSLEAGYVLFTPDPDFSGEAYFRYWITDGRGGHASALVKVGINAVNDPPVVDGITFDTAPNRWAQKNWEGDLYMFKDPTVESGRVLAHDIDSPGPLRFELDKAPVHGHASVDASGAWTYHTELVDPYVGPDPFWVLVKDSEGGASVATVETSHVKDQKVRLQDKKPRGWTPPPRAAHLDNSMQGPVVIDLGGDGLQLIDAASSPAQWDVNGDGAADQMGWIGPQDAFLALDRDGDGRITRLDEFSFMDDWPGARTDLEGLQAFDTNGDGMLSAEDERWQDFGLFQDLNSNGIQDEGEFTPMVDTGIVAISLTGQGEAFDINGNLVMGMTTVWMADGSTREAGDVMLRVIDGAKARANALASSAQEQQVSQQVDQLLSAMAGFAPQPAGEVCMAEHYPSSLRVELAVPCT